MPSGLHTLLRSIFPHADRWGEPRSSRSSRSSLSTTAAPPAPVRIKLRAENERQLELKIVYSVLGAGGARSRFFKVELFLFADAALFSEHPTLEFFSNLYGVVRLHTPRVSLAALGDGGTAGAPLAVVAAAVKAAVATAAAALAALDAEASLCPPTRRVTRVTRAADASNWAAEECADTLRLHACMFRAAIRREAAAAADALRAARDADDGGDGGGAAAAAAAAMSVDLVRAACEAMEGLAAACDPLEPPHSLAPPWLTEAWQLVDECCLLEGERSLVKLLVAAGVGVGGAAGHGAAGAPAPAAPHPPPPLHGSRSITRSYSFRGELSMKLSSALAPAGPRLAAPLPPPPPPRAAPRVEPAGWAGRYPHLDAGRSSALRHRHSLDSRSVAGGSPRSDGGGGGSALGSPPPPPPSPPHSTLPTPLAGVRDLVREAVAGLEAARARRGYADSLLRDGAPPVNEGYTNRLQLLKKHARAAISLTPRSRAPSSWLLADVVGAVVAAAAMAFALWTVWLSQRQSTQFGALYLVLLIGGYVVKDRMKEWGKRWLQPVAEWFGAWFPDRRVRLADARGARVGTMAERVTLVDPSSLPPRVLAFRHEGSTLGAHARAAAQPERVLKYEKRVDVAWKAVAPRVRSVGALSDVMRFDLAPLTRRMQPPLEAHARLAPAGGGVEVVPCQRVYHVNLVLRIRAADRGRGVPSARPSAAGARAGAPDPAPPPPPPLASSVMLLERARVVMSAAGVVRLESAGRSRFAAKEAGRPLAGLGSRVSASVGWRGRGMGGGGAAGGV